MAGTTRQQLDELDALLQRMLALPVGTPEEEPPAREEESPVRYHTADYEPTPVSPAPLMTTPVAQEPPPTVETVSPPEALGETSPPTASVNPTPVPLLTPTLK